MRTSDDYHTGDHYDLATFAFVMAGFKYTTIKSIAGDEFDNWVYRGAFVFDLGPMAGRVLQKATLHLRVSNTEVQSGYDNLRSCGDELGTGKASWWAGSDWIEADWVDSTIGTGPKADVDVTQEVRSWMNGKPNWGFVLRSQQENINAFTEAKCISTYDPPTLTVEYFP
jgi:hypothetical protein